MVNAWSLLFDELNMTKHSTHYYDYTRNDPDRKNPFEGDVMKLDLKMKGDVIEDVKFKTYGCGSAIASSTMFVEMLKGKTIEEAKAIKDKDIADALQLPPIKLHCSVLAEEAIHKAIQNWKPMIVHNRGPND